MLLVAVALALQDSSRNALEEQARRVREWEARSEAHKLSRQAKAERAAGRFSQARALYQQILPMEPDSPDRLIVLLHETVRGEARHSIAVCYESEGRFEEALEAYRESERKPMPSDCGNAASGFQIAMLEAQGRCLEHLGRHAEAVQAYFLATERWGGPVIEAAVLRIVDLYEGAGRLGRLREILDERDRAYVAGFEPQERESLGRQGVKGSPSNDAIRRLVDVREAASRSEWGKLVDVLEGQCLLPYIDGFQEIITAAQRLAEHPERTVPLLKAKLGKGMEDQSFVYYALGLCGTPEAVQILRDRAEALGRLGYQEQRQWHLMNLCHALSLSDGGRTILLEFKKNGSEALTQAMANHRESRLPPGARPKYPDIPKDVRLD